MILGIISKRLGIEIGYADKSKQHRPHPTVIDEPPGIGIERKLTRLIALSKCQRNLLDDLNFSSSIARLQTLGGILLI